MLGNFSLAVLLFQIQHWQIKLLGNSQNLPRNTKANINFSKDILCLMLMELDSRVLSQILIY